MKKSTLKRIAAVAAAILLGCGSAAWQASAAEKKDTLVVAFSAEPTSMSTLDNELMESIYSAHLTNSFLVKIDPATMEPKCDLAESYELASDTEYVFKLRKGVKFHHGKEFKAEDVVASIENAKKYPGSMPYTQAIEKVEALDDHTVKFTMTSPYPNLLYDLGFKCNFILPADLLANGHDFANKPVGTGPYKLMDWKRGEALTYERFDDYFNKEEMPSIKTFVWRVIPEGTARTIALEAGEIDLIFQVETADITRLKENSKVTVEELTSVENYALAFNADHKPFDDVNLRRAISHAIDREAIVIGALNGYGVPNATSVPKGYWGSTEEGAREFDLDKAREYMKAWGGDPSTVKLPILCWNEELVRVATVVQGCLEEIGIAVEVDPVDSATFSSRRASGENYVACFTLWSPSNAFNFVGRYHSSRRAWTVGSCNDEQVDELIGKMQVELNDEARLKLIHQIVARVNDLAVQPSVYQPIIFRAYSSNLAGVKFSAHGYADFHTAYWK